MECGTDPFVWLFVWLEGYAPSERLSDANVESQQMHYGLPRFGAGWNNGCIATGLGVVVVVVVVVAVVVVMPYGHCTPSGYVDVKLVDMQQELAQLSAAASSGSPLYHLLEKTAVPGCR